MVAKHRMLWVDKPRDYVLASGRTHSPREFVDAAFSHASMETQDRLEMNRGVICASDLNYSAIYLGMIERRLGQKAELDLEAIDARMMEALNL